MAPLIRFGSRQIRCIEKVTKTTSSSQKENNNDDRQPKNSSNANKKSVSFHKSVKVRLSIHINDYTEAEIEKCWYNREEFQAIQADIGLTSALINHGALSNRDTTEHHCRRGVECKMGHSLLRKQQLRMAGWYAVLCKQACFQQLSTTHQGALSPTSDAIVYDIADAYSVASASALSIARATALMDEIEI